MVKKVYLSSEVSRLRALVLGGASAKSIKAELAAWRMEHFGVLKSNRRAAFQLSELAEELDAVIGDASELGGKLDAVLRESQHRARRLERFLSRVASLRKQFAFQGAVAMVIPWGVAAVQGGFSWNIFFLIGLGFQMTGALLFSVLLKRVSRPILAEQRFLLRFLTNAWMRVLCGFSLSAALGVDLARQPQEDPFTGVWKQWFQARSSGVHQFSWPAWASGSEGVARTLDTLIASGAPAAETLADFVIQLEDERQSVFEDRVQELPTRLALVFCVSFTPAVFSILMGSIWPSLNAIL